MRLVLLHSFCQPVRPKPPLGCSLELQLPRWSSKEEFD